MSNNDVGITKEHSQYFISHAAIPASKTAKDTPRLTCRLSFTDMLRSFTISLALSAHH